MMDFQPFHYYHIYNRSNARQPIFRNSENYLFFLKNFRKRLDGMLSVIAYCLMPTHFHFLIHIDTKDIASLKKQIGIHLASYTKAFNKVYQRNGSLFQQHTKAKEIDDESYLITLISYIHQNPVRSNLASNLQDWPYSSYRDLAGMRDGTLPDCSVIQEYFKSTHEFIEYSEVLLDQVKKKYWV